MKRAEFNGYRIHGQWFSSGNAGISAGTDHHLRVVKYLEEEVIPGWKRHYKETHDIRSLRLACYYAARANIIKRLAQL